MCVCVWHYLHADFGVTHQRGVYSFIFISFISWFSLICFDLVLLFALICKMQWRIQIKDSHFNHSIRCKSKKMPNFPSCHLIIIVIIMQYVLYSLRFFPDVFLSLYFWHFSLAQTFSDRCNVRSPVILHLKIGSSERFFSSLIIIIHMKVYSHAFTFVQFSNIQIRFGKQM